MTEIWIDLDPILSKDLKETPKRIAPSIGKKNVVETIPKIHSEGEYVFPVVPSSTPIKTRKSKSEPKHDPMLSRNYEIKIITQS